MKCLSNMRTQVCFRISCKNQQNYNIWINMVFCLSESLWIVYSKPVLNFIIYSIDLHIIYYFDLMVPNTQIFFRNETFSFYMFNNHTKQSVNKLSNLNICCVIIYDERMMEIPMDYKFKCTQYVCMTLDLFN